MDYLSSNEPKYGTITDYVSGDPTGYKRYKGSTTYRPSSNKTVYFNSYCHKLHRHQKGAHWVSRLSGCVCHHTSLQQSAVACLLILDYTNWAIIDNASPPRYDRGLSSSVTNQTPTANRPPVAPTWHLRHGSKGQQMELVTRGSSGTSFKHWPWARRE